MDNSESLDGASGGFSLMHALKGGASVASGSTGDGDSTARLREGLATSASPAKASSTATSPSTAKRPHRNPSHRSPPAATASANHHAAVPLLRTANSFTSASSSSQRRPANYRNRHAPKKFSPKHQKRSSAAEAQHWLSPSKSLDGEDRPSRSEDGQGSVHAHRASGGERGGHGPKKATGFGHYYSSAAPGYHDAFTLLEGADPSSPKRGGSNPSPQSSPDRHPSSKAARAPASPRPELPDPSEDNAHSAPPAVSRHENGPSSASTAATTAPPGTPRRGPARGTMPPPPSGHAKKPSSAAAVKTKAARAPSPIAMARKARGPAAAGRASSPLPVVGPPAAASSPMRHASPLSASRVKSTLQKLGSVGRRRGSRSRSKGSGNYSDAVSKALEEDAAAGGLEAVHREGGKLPTKGGGAKSSGSKSTGRSQEGSEAVSPRSSSGGGKGGGFLPRVVRNRSPSPVRQMGSLEGGAADAGSGGAERCDDASAPSFFGMRQMSPGRRNRGWRMKRPTIPASPRRTSRPQPQQSSPDNPSLPRYPVTDREGVADDGDGGLDPVSASLAHTTMSFDVDGDAPEQPHRPLAEEPADGSALLPSPIPELESELETEDGYFINTTTFNIFESREFLRAMGGNANEASLTTNYIRMGDGLCRGEGHNVGERLDRAAAMYYAGLGKVLIRIRDWTLEQRGHRRRNSSELLDENGNYIPLTPNAELSELSHKDFLEVAHSPEANVLLLAISSILLRAGNAHFRRRHWKEACRDYDGAQSYRSLWHKTRDAMAVERREYNDIYFEDAKLHGRISNNAASARSKRAMYEEARSEYTRALQIKQGTLEALHKRSGADGSGSGSGSGSGEVDDSDLVSDIASTFHNIGLLRMECGEPKKAEKAYKQSLSLRVKKFGLDDLGVSSTLRALGDLYHYLRQYDDAFRSYKESLRIWKSHGGKSDLRTAEHYYNIGLVFYSKGPLAKARASVAECLRIRRLLCSGKEHLLVAAALYLLGLIASSSGNYDEALSLLEESLDIRLSLLESSDHLLLFNVQLALGTVHCKKSDLESAMDYFSVALAGRKRRLGKDHISVSEVLHAIGAAYTMAHEYRKAFKTLEEAMRIRKLASPGMPSLEVAETLDGLSLVLFKSGDTEKAIELSEEALDVLKAAVGFDHLWVSGMLKNTGDYYQDLEAYDDAMEAYNESLRVMTAWHGREHVFLSEVLNEIGVTRFKKGEYVVAKQSFSEALRLMRLTHNEANKSAIFPTLNHLGHALYKNNELKLAAETYIESFNIQVSIVTGDTNDGFKGFGPKLISIKDRIATMERNEEDVSELSEYLGGIASILRYLGLVIQEQGDFEAALSTNKLSLSVRLCQPFKEHSAIALMAETIAMFEYKRNNLSSAMDYFNQALQAKKSYQGESTIDVARTVNNLANIHFSLGNLDDAMGLYQEALKIKRHCLGDESDDVANTLNNIAHVMVNAGKAQEALAVYHNVVKIRQDRYGKSHFAVATTFASIGDAHINLGELETAMTYFEQCIRIQKLHQDRCDVRVLENLGSVYGKLGEWHKAESTFEEIIELKRAAHGDDCLDVAKMLDLLAVSYIEQDRHAESIEHLQEALRIRKACLDDENNEILASLNKLAFVYKSLDMTVQMVEMKEEFEALRLRINRTGTH